MAPTELTVPLPDALRDALVERLGPEGARGWGLEAMLVEAARQGLVSRRKAATLLGIDAPDDREAFFERHGLTLEYTPEMLEEDWRTIQANA